MQDIKHILKRSLIYRKIYEPIMIKKAKKFIARRRALFEEGAESLLRNFVECMNENNIPYWLEFGTLLGAYRDGDFIPNDIDLDVGAYLKDANRIYHSLLKSGFKLVREFHVVGENGLEQTYEYNGVTIDVMYFYEREGLFWCNSAVLTKKRNKAIYTQVTAHWFIPFTIVQFDFMGISVFIPENIEEHLKEIYGVDFMIYNPNFKGDLNKCSYKLSKKSGNRFIYY